MPIVGWSDYGFLSNIIELGGNLFLCSPNVPLEKMTPEDIVFFCMQNDELSPLEIFRMIMWQLENAVVGGYESNAEDAINFLKANGITMRQGEIRLTFDIEKTQGDCYTLHSHDDRDIKMGHYDSLERMAWALYNVLICMRIEFNVGFYVDFCFNGEGDKEFASMLEGHHSPDDFNLSVEI